MVTDPSNIKRALRAELRERRRTRTSVERAAATSGFTSNLEKLVTDTGSTYLSCYLSATHEPNTREFLNWARTRGIRTLFPVAREDGLLDWTRGDGDAEAEGLFGMPEPVGEVLGPMEINDVDLILVPAAAVDTAGVRLGWGRGYFDKTLGSMQKCPPVYALIFDDELLESVPREIHDQPVDGVVTPTRIVTF
ncbi:5-formyltetrahydrofolate cyclo-ligase [Agreia sp. COWG]|uniref:5-formyltetrahydrofolate cyclo-ligase n=1 Tax=Agreia sp. COWG TaxID=2773266 RepID=UPI001926B32C|nr:5-formyltetrahydrofolate cyclo-ligase [Agreia sp. COWG]CAD6003176.1 5-formyltetrahydrofolate cyclo-ligase [Agreia sp. COWG]